VIILLDHIQSCLHIGHYCVNDEIGVWKEKSGPYPTILFEAITTPILEKIIQVLHGITFDTTLHL
jgi:hypothetical protein